MKILITGATGYLGKEILKNPILQDHDLVLLTRNKDKKNSIDGSNQKISWVRGDLTHPEIFFSEDDKSYALDVDLVLHAAAFYDLEGSYADCFMGNVVATTNILNFYKNSKKLQAFHYVSTIAIFDPLGEKHLFENDFPERTIFDDHYSHTKYITESVFRNFKFKNDKIVKRIYRPGIIVCSSLNSKNYKKDGPYYFAKSLKTFGPLLHYLPFIPLNYDPEATIPIVPVDHVANFMVHSLFNTNFNKRLSTYHLISDSIPKLSKFLESLLCSLKIPGKVKATEINLFNDFILKKIGIPKETIPFMFHRHSYDKSNSAADFEVGFTSHYGDYHDVLMKSFKDVD